MCSEVLTICVIFFCSNDEDRRSENDDRVEYKDEEANVTEVKNIKINSNNIESKSSSKSNRKIDLGAAANFGKDQNSVVSNSYLVFLSLFLFLSYY